MNGVRSAAMVLIPSFALLLATSCARRNARAGEGASPPAALIGSFEDDYGERYIVSPTEWVQLPRSRHRVVRWNVAEQYAIAQNDSSNRSAPGKWMRIDWVMLSGMPPYEWGFCYSAHDAATEALAAATAVARKDTPRTGCDGYPYSRMKRAEKH